MPKSVPSRPRASLARATLLEMGMRIALVIALGTLFSISNSKYALDAAPAEQRCLTLRVEAPASDRVRIEVSDNGVGIAPELLTRIFQHGFTTREEGHGFGLHSSALAAQELGGTLTAHSDGPGRGATFTLELPCTPPEAA